MLAGQLTDFSIDDIFQLLSLTKKSGALRVDTPDGEGRVYWADGAVFFATADVRRLTLGARLVGAGALTEEQLRDIAAQREQGGAVEFAAALLRSDLVDGATIESYLADQINESVGRLLRQTDGAFNFDSGATVDSWPGPSFAVDDLLAEGHRRLGEWESISASIPALDRPLALVPTLGSQDIAIAADQWQLIALIDGARTAKDLVELTGKGEFATCKVLAALVSTGLVELRPADGRTALEELLSARGSLRRLEEVALARPVRPAAAPAEPAPQPGSEAEPEPAPQAQHQPESQPEPGSQPGSASAAEPESASEPAAPTEADEHVAASDAGHDDAGDDDAGDDDARDDDAGDDDAGDDDADESSAQHDDPPAPRRDVSLDRAQMARELASLGLNDPEPLRRAAHRATAQQATVADQPAAAGVEADEHRAAAAADATAHPDPEADAHQAAAEAAPETMTEHRLSGDTSMNRGMLLRLIDGIQGG